MPADTILTVGFLCLKKRHLQGWRNRFSDEDEKETDQCVCMCCANCAVARPSTSKP